MSSKAQTQHGNKQKQFMNRNIWKQAAVAVAFSAASGVAFAQAANHPAGSHTSKADSAESSAHIIVDQTQAPEKSTSKAKPADSMSGPGAGSSKESAAKIISDQTKSAGSAASGRSPANAATPGAPSTESAAHIIKDQTEPPSSAHGAHSPNSGSRK